MKNHIRGFETQSLTQFVAGGEKKHQEVFWRQGESNLNAINSSTVGTQQTGISWCSSL